MGSCFFFIWCGPRCGSGCGDAGRELAEAAYAATDELAAAAAGCGIRVVHMDPDLREVDVEMRMRRWNRNYAGTYFGCSLFAMTDPLYMMMVIENPGNRMPSPGVRSPL